MADFHSYRPTDGHRLPHDPLKAIVAPRPIGWISTADPSGGLNLAPYSFFNMISDTPPMLAFSSRGWKDSVRNAGATGEFAWNLATRPLAEQMNLTSVEAPADVDEFAMAGLTPLASTLIDPPRVAESPAALECKVVQILRLHDLEGVETNQWLVIGQVVAVHIQSSFLVDGLFDTGAAQPILRAGYAADYMAACSDSLFKMYRPR